MIIITGASRGIGNFLFKSLILEEDVLGTYLNSKPNEYQDKFFKVNVCNYEQVESFFSSKTESLKNITLINCAGISDNAFTHKSDPNKWREVIDTNLLGTYNFIRVLLPIMRKQKYGRIINFSSVVATKPTPGISSYSASKSALWGLAKSVAVENAALNVTINSINMGYSELGMIDKVPPSFKEKILSQIPMGRFCDPHDILETVQYLRKTGYITGSTIDLSGGIV